MGTVLMTAPELSFEQWLLYNNEKPTKKAFKMWLREQPIRKALYEIHRVLTNLT